MRGFWARADAEDFAAALEGRKPANAEIDELLRVATSICAAAVVEPSPEFSSSLRSRLMTDASEVLVVEKRATHGVQSPAHQGLVQQGPLQQSPTRKRLAAAVAAVVVAGSGVGIAASSAGAVPGDMLYPIKRGIENTEIAVKNSDDARGAIQLDRAGKRLDEARTLALADDPRTADQIGETIDEFTLAAEEVSELLFSDYASSGSVRSIDTVYAFASGSSEQLAALKDLIPEGAAGSYDDAAATLMSLTERAADMCTTCADSPLEDVALSLTESVQQVAEQQSADRPARSSPPSDIPGRDDAADPADPPAPATSAPKIPEQIDEVTEPVKKRTRDLVGDLASDDHREGLVPGLLDGLTGTR